MRPDNTYEVKIDNSQVESGSLEDDWDFLPPKKIKDPDAAKPEDWDERAKIDLIPPRIITILLTYNTILINIRLDALTLLSAKAHSIILNIVSSQSHSSETHMCHSSCLSYTLPLPLLSIVDMK